MGITNITFIGWILISKLFALLIDHKKETIKPADFYCTFQIYKQPCAQLELSRVGLRSAVLCASNTNA